jgi:AbrB family looped-hinge helix DNA binding protein
MKTTIDGAGRIVVPKSLRDAMGLTAGVELDVMFTDGHLEIDFAPATVEIDQTGLPRLLADGDMPPLDEAVVRATLEGSRR